MFENYSIKEANIHTKLVTDLKWNSTGSYLASTSQDKTTKIGQMDGQGILKHYQTISKSANFQRLSWNPTESSSLCMAGECKHVEIWDVKGNCITNKIPSIGNIINVIWSPNGHYIALGNKSDVVAVLDVRMNRQLNKMKFNYEVNEIGWSYNSDHLMVTTGGDVGGLDVLKVAFDGDNADITTVASFEAHTSNCYNLKIDNNFRRMAIGSADFLVSLWELEDLVCYRTISLFDSATRSLSFSGNGNFIAIAAESNNVVICDTTSGEQVGAIDCKCHAIELAWHPVHNIIAMALDPDSSADDSPRYRGADKKQYAQIASFQSSKK